jgi:hypothetical protein
MPHTVVQIHCKPGRYQEIEQGKNKKKGLFHKLKILFDAGITYTTGCFHDRPLYNHIPLDKLLIAN